MLLIFVDIFWKHFFIIFLNKKLTWQSLNYWISISWQVTHFLFLVYISQLFIKLVNYFLRVQLHIWFFSHLNWITAHKTILSKVTDLIVTGLSLTSALSMIFKISAARCQVMRRLVQVVQLCDRCLIAASNVRWRSLSNLVYIISLMWYIFVTIVHIDLMRWKWGKIIGIVVMPLSVVATTVF